MSLSFQCPVIFFISIWLLYLFQIFCNNSDETEFIWKFFPRNLWKYFFFVNKIIWKNLYRKFFQLRHPLKTIEFLRVRRIFLSFLWINRMICMISSFTRRIWLMVELHSWKFIKSLPLLTQSDKPIRKECGDE